MKAFPRHLRGLCFQRNQEVYGLMFDAENIGNIFPTQDGTSNIYYISNKINSNGSKIRQYNQLEIAIDTNWIYAMSAKSGGESIGLLEYLNELLK